MRIEFKKKALLDTVPDPAKIVNLWDTGSQGLGLRITPNGAKIFVFKYQRMGRGHWLTLGRLGDLTIDDARAKAAELRKAVSLGQDPALALKPKPKGMTVSEAAERMMAEHSPRLRPKTIGLYQGEIDKRIGPTLGKLPIAALSPADVAALHAKQKHIPRQANIMLAVLRIICKYAEKWGERPLGSNPCQHQEKYPENARHRYLTEAEIAAIGKALNAMDGRYSGSALDALRLIMLTGARRGEILNLRWSQVDLKGRALRFEPSEHKTGGASHAKQIPIGEAAIAILKARQRAGRGHDLVFYGDALGKPLGAIFKVWKAVREEASKGKIDVTDVHIHDLRHTWGTVATSSGHALQVIGAVMGHRNASTTARYAHVAPSPAARAVEETSAKIAAALKGRRK
jgi:integrase